MTVLLMERKELESKQESNAKVQRNNDKPVNPKYSHITASLSPFPHGFHDSQLDPFEMLYSNAVDRPCSSVCGHDELDFFLNCRQPLSFFRPHTSAEHDPDDDVAEYTPYPPSSSSPPRLPGMYDLPTHCEYCGASHTDHCDPGTCERPVLFFRKLRPPFAAPDWDTPPQQQSHLQILEEMETSSSCLTSDAGKSIEGEQESYVNLHDSTDINSNMIDATNGTTIMTPSPPFSIAESTYPVLQTEEESDETDLVDTTTVGKLETETNEISQVDSREKGETIVNHALTHQENSEICEKPTDRIETEILASGSGISEKITQQLRCTSLIQENQRKLFVPLPDIQEWDQIHVDGLLYKLDQHKPINCSLPSNTIREDRMYHESSSLESFTTFTSTLFLTKSSRWEEFGLTNILVSPCEVEMVTAM